MKQYIYTYFYYKPKLSLFINTFQFIVFNYYIHLLEMVQYEKYSVKDLHILYLLILFSLPFIYLQPGRLILVVNEVNCFFTSYFTSFSFVCFI